MTNVEIQLRFNTFLILIVYLLKVKTDDDLFQIINNEVLHAFKYHAIVQKGLLF